MYGGVDSTGEVWASRTADNYSSIESAEPLRSITGSVLDDTPPRDVAMQHNRASCVFRAIVASATSRSGGHGGPCGFRTTTNGTGGATRGPSGTGATSSGSVGKHQRYQWSNRTIVPLYSESVA